MSPPYPDQVASSQTTPETSLDPASNPLSGSIGNAHTQRATADSQGAILAGGIPTPPYTFGLSYEESATLMQIVYDTAGVAAGVTPGADATLIAGIPAEPAAARHMSTLTGALPVAGFSTSDDWSAISFRNVYIRNEGDAKYFSAATHSGTTSGTGTELDPYIINDFMSFNANGNGDPQLEEGSLLLWDDPTANYHVKVTNSHLRTTDTQVTNPSFRVNVPAGQTILFDTCQMYCSKAAVNVDFIRVESGTMLLNVVLTTAIQQNNVVMDGPNAVFDATNWKVTDTLSGLSGSFLVTEEGSSGCSISLDHVSYLPENTINRVVCYFINDLTLDVNSCEFSNKARADSLSGNGIVQFWNPNVSTELMPLPKTFIDTAIYSNSATMFAGANVTSDFFYTNVTFLRCDMYHANAIGARMIECGPQPSALRPIVDSWHISWCRFEKENESQSPGNEVMYLNGVEGCIVEYCWTHSAPEDCYEMYWVRNNNKIRFCGVGDPAGTNGAHIQAAEMFLAAENLLTSGNEIHDIWGHCGGEGALITDVSNVKTWNILTKSNADIYAPVSAVGDAVPSANVSVVHRFPSETSPTGCHNSGSCTQDSESSGRDNGVPTAWNQAGQSGESAPAGNTDVAIRKPALIPV